MPGPEAGGPYRRTAENITGGGQELNGVDPSSVTMRHR
jgi:hypothetical protein